MTDREALLRAVIENPADDAPRLVYTDWLDEHGDPDRAEFIRLAITNPNADGVRDLLARHGDSWRAEAPSLPGVQWGMDLGRGFVHQAYLKDWAAFVPVRERMFAAVPLDDLAIDGVTTPELKLLATEPRFRRLTSLTLCGSFTDDAVENLAHSPYVCNLRCLYLSGRTGWGPDDTIGSRSGRALTHSPYLGNLRNLYAAGNRFSTKVRAELRRRFPDAVV